jgi:hypothetical protein
MLGVLRAQQGQARLKAAAKYRDPGYRTSLADVRAKGVAPGTIEVKGTYKIGRPEPKPETMALHLLVLDSDGKAVVDKELSRREIPAWEANTQTRISERVNVPSGRYEVRIYTHRPRGKRRLLDGSFEPWTNSRVCLFDIVVP